jgi:murein DD-endopeptidase MepM/ murein hydrolase activator NlpD
MEPKKEKSKWSDRFRLILLRDENLEKVKTFQFSKLQFFLATILSILIIIATTTTVISFTPIKRLIPGYAEIKENRIYVDLLNKVKKLEREAVENKTYIEKIQSLLSGENLTDTNESYMGQNDTLTTASIVDRIQEDEQLRNKVSPPNKRGLSLPRVMSGGGSTKETLQGRTLVAPIKGVISAPFKSAKEHYGIDILAPALTPIKSVDEGIVISADWTMETGYTIGIQHDDNLISYYKHNSALLKKTGESVAAGEAIAIIGNTGHLTSGPHLHFELWYNGQSLDPSQFIAFED